ncbi:MAG: alpha/beta hydrolase [Burkholderiaceae bacterium]|jgi:pimeloyl-ACP methyl ester carboxylesterase|nr:alpha/beta hydrolase [Burkholderiaceae bacterium]
MSSVLAPPAAELARLDAAFAARLVPVAGAGAVSVRECGAGTALVCLHGIGSGSASWFECALALAGDARVLAWDAPGYGASTPLLPPRPAAADYAARLLELLDALAIEDCVLVGHSLGALVAAAAARRGSGSPWAGRIRRLALISPAIGYGAPGREAECQRVRAERLDTLQRLGIAGMAAQRAGRLLSEHADERAHQWVRWNMGRLHEQGYRQAVELLCGGNLLADLPPAMPAHVACGALDVVTTPESCTLVAERCGVPLERLPDAGHACYVEQPERVAAWLRRVLAS